MKLIDWLRGLFGNEEAVYINAKFENTRNEIMFERYFTQLAINLIAGAVSKCEFKTMAKGRPVRGDEYYSWNVQPNVNQNSSEFLQKLVEKLLYNNEALVVEVGGQYLIADSFSCDENVTRESIFRGVTCGNMTFNRDFAAHDVMYFRYGNQNVRALLDGILAGYKDLLNMAVGKYRRAGGRKGTLRITTQAGGNEPDREKLDDLFNKQFRSYFDSENAVVHLPRGFDYTEIPGEGSKKSTSELTDIENIMNSALSRVALAFKIPPSLLSGSIANVDDLTDNFLTFCIDPLCDLMEEEITRKLYSKKSYLEGNYLTIDTTSIRHIDVFAIAEKADKLISNGLYSIDELREKIGDAPVGEPWSRQHWMTKNYEDVDSAEGGDDGETNPGIRESGRK